MTFPSTVVSTLVLSELRAIEMFSPESVPVTFSRPKSVREAVAARSFRDSSHSRKLCMFDRCIFMCGFLSNEPQNECGHEVCGEPELNGLVPGGSEKLPSREDFCAA